MGELEETRALFHVRRWLDTEARLLVLCGRVGGGKSVAGAMAYLRAGAAYVAAQELPQRSDPWGDEASRFTKLDPKTGALVVLDDLGTESRTDRWLQACGRDSGPIAAAER